MFIFDEKILQQINELKNEDVENYISSRIQFLEKNTDESRTTLEPSSYNKSATSHGFIPITTEICAEAGSSPLPVGGFLLDDNKIYEVLISNLKKHGSVQSLNDVLQSIQNSVDEYFGGIALAENETNRRDLYLKMLEKYGELEPYPISEYRNNNTALCSERAAIAQNMLAFLGADTYFMMGHLSRNDDIANMNHAYNCIVDKENGNGIVVDFTNPILRETSNEMYVYHSNIINKDSISDFLSGEYQVEMDRPEFYQQDGIEMKRTLHCSYSLNSLSKDDLSKLQAIPSKEIIYLIDTINPELLQKNMKLPNGVEIPAKQYIEEVVMPYIPENQMFALKDGTQITAKQFIEEYVMNEGQGKFNGDIKALMDAVIAEEPNDKDGRKLDDLPYGEPAQENDKKAKSIEPSQEGNETQQQRHQNSVATPQEETPEPPQKDRKAMWNELVGRLQQQRALDIAVRNCERAVDYYMIAEQTGYIKGNYFGTKKREHDMGQSM